MHKRSSIETSQFKKELKLIEKEKSDVTSTTKKFGLHKSSTLTMKSNTFTSKNLTASNSKKNIKPPQNQNLSSSKLMNSTLNKGDKSSFIEDDSKILVTSQSKSRIRTGGNDINAAKMFTKLFEKNKNTSKTIKSGKESSVGKNSKGNFGKINTDNITSKIDTGLSESFKRKSLSVKAKDNKKPDFINHLSNKNNNQNNSSLNQSADNNNKKKNNFISRKSLAFSRTNATNSTNKVVDTVAGSKLSKQSILGRIISTRNIKGDDRNNMLTDINFEVANTQQDIIGQRKSLKNFHTSKSSHNGFDYEFERKFSSSLRSNKPIKMHKRNNSMKKGKKIILLFVFFIITTFEIVYFSLFRQEITKERLIVVESQL